MPEIIKILKTFPKNIESIEKAIYLMKGEEYSLRSLCELTQVNNRSTWHKWIKNKRSPRLNTFRQVSYQLNISPIELMAIFDVIHFEEEVDSAQVCINLVTSKLSNLDINEKQINAIITYIKNNRYSGLGQLRTNPKKERGYAENWRRWIKQEASPTINTLRKVSRDLGLNSIEIVAIFEVYG